MNLIEIEFKGRRKGTFVNPQEFPLKLNDLVIVQADRGENLGRISLIGPEWQEHIRRFLPDGFDEEFPSVLRLAGAKEFEQDKENRKLEFDARGFFLDEVKRLGLEMKLVDIEYQLDRRKLTFYFTADGRVDFRELVKVLANHFRTRIDLRQIGARDEAKRLGGMGICGRELCCATWIREFLPVTTLMLKEQGLLLNPQKNTGLCGKLRCCLRYEVDQYREVNTLFPKTEAKVKGPRGSGYIEKINMCQANLGVVWEGGKRVSYTASDLKKHTDWNPEKREETELVIFKTDPSVELEKRDQTEGHLVASQDPEPKKQHPKRREQPERGSRRQQQPKRNGEGHRKPQPQHKHQRRQEKPSTIEGTPYIPEPPIIVPLEPAEKVDSPKREQRQKSRPPRRERMRPPRREQDSSEKQGKRQQEKRSQTPSRDKSPERGERRNTEHPKQEKSRPLGKKVKLVGKRRAEPVRKSRPSDAKGKNEQTQEHDKKSSDSSGHTKQDSKPKGFAHRDTRRRKR